MKKGSRIRVARFPASVFAPYAAHRVFRKKNDFTLDFFSTWGYSKYVHYINGVMVERLRQRFAKPVLVGSTPTHASNFAPSLRRQGSPSFPLPPLFLSFSGPDPRTAPVQPRTRKRELSFRCWFLSDLPKGKNTVLFSVSCLKIFYYSIIITGRNLN